MTNSAHFVATIGNGKIQDHKITVSFDVELLFTSVPIEGAVQAVPWKLESDVHLADRETVTPVQTVDLF